MDPCDHDHADLRESLAAAARLLPAQGPIDTFIHHNTLHAFEHLPFEEAVVAAAAAFGTEPFLPESRYRAEFARGRIREADIEAVLDDEWGQADAARLAGGRVTRRDLRRALVLHPLVAESDAAVRWTLAETDAIDRPAIGVPAAFSRELWHACLEAASRLGTSWIHARPPVRHRDLMLACEPTLDTDALVHPLLIRVTAAFLDQGVASWPMPGRDAGLLPAFVELAGGRFVPRANWCRTLPAAVAGVAGRPALEVAAEEIERLGVPREHRAEFVAATLLALRGWAGMIHHLELRPDRCPVERVPARLDEFLAVRLVLDRVAVDWAAGRLGWPRPAPGNASWGALWVELRDRHPPRRGPGSVARAFLLHQVSLRLGLSAQDIRGLDDGELAGFAAAIAACDGPERRRLFQRAFERRHRMGMLDALALHGGVTPRIARRRPRLQAVFCIDERCESFRRHLEELGPERETFGAAGFFGVAMVYRGVDDWHAFPLCPIVIRPEHSVVEVPAAESASRHDRWRIARRAGGRLAGPFAFGGRTLLGGGLFAAGAGAVAAVPLVARVVFPRLSARLARSAVGLARRRIDTRLELERAGSARLADGTLPGFDVAEMTAIVRRLLEDIGLTAGFARLVAVIGHGSSSRNNPHGSAYDCGACGGGRGGPNARSFAAMANDPRVRRGLAEDGIHVPDDTWFVGGMLDTCTDAVAWYDLERVPATHAADLRDLRADVAVASGANALERCRRFESARDVRSPREALRHVEARAEDLAQVRPELGHATNAACIVGRRARSRGLFLDRRAFLVSYDPDADADGAILGRLLAAVVPVCAGINLEYFFSATDGTGYGCGTKLPHNIAGLVGVMDGHASDLRTGLPRQMVEIHEPVRLLVVIDAPEERILAALATLPAVDRLVRHGWIGLAAWREDGTPAWFRAGTFEPHVPGIERLPTVSRSVDWYAGQSDNLPPARVRAGAADPGVAS